ncbi:histone-lysine N-methyltransferase ATXR2-like isoform X2 [Arachis ipaensis]|uniref:histone-lysine N-methyltransferase ATXR2-like isoform X2 n=1 Tax=Arachis ipaensis TaxID=130454 RepID=UPI000A2B7E1B|nr:histone-lysine N-methyltransferase ATXR2-like isoform X2 [Arachis ipaensis]
MTVDLVVASPVEDYFLYIDDLKNPDKELLFFPLQSCMNHSCSPNAKAFKRDEDRDGQATIIAVRPIRKGEEVSACMLTGEWLW